MQEIEEDIFGSLPEDDAETTPVKNPSGDCPDIVEPTSEDSEVVSDLTQIFIPSEEDRTGRGQQNSRLLQLVEYMESEGGKERRAEGWISQESRRLLAAKSAALHNNKPDLVRSYGKELRRQLRKDRKERVRRVSEEVEERLVAKDVIGVYELFRP